MRDVINGNGNVIDHLSYNSFGQVAYESAPSVSHIDGFAGGLYDPSTQLVYFIHRWYDPTATVWISADPMGFAAGDANLTRYVGNEVTNATDPQGLVNPAVVGVMIGPAIVIGPSRASGPAGQATVTTGVNVPTTRLRRLNPFVLNNARSAADNDVLQGKGYLYTTVAVIPRCGTPVKAPMIPVDNDPIELEAAIDKAAKLMGGMNAELTLMLRTMYNAGIARARGTRATQLCYHMAGAMSGSLTRIKHPSYTAENVTLQPLVIPEGYAYFDTGVKITDRRTGKQIYVHFVPYYGVFGGPSFKIDTLPNEELRSFLRNRRPPPLHED